MARASIPSAAAGIAVALAMLCLPAGGHANAARQPAAKPLERALERIVDAHGGPPGVLALVHRGGRDELYRAGVADVRSRRPLRPRDHFRIASVAKAFNGAVALSLVADGRLRLATTVGDWLPGVLPLAAPVTLRQALQHVGGLPDYIRSPSFVERLLADPAAYMAPLELLAYVRDEPLEFQPGSRYRYSDSDNIVAGLMAEAATGRSYERLLARLVYRRIGLRRTSLPRTTAMPRPYVRGYDVEPGRRPEDVSSLINPAGAWASGGIVSTPRDLGRFVRAYAGGRLVGGRARRAQLRFRAGASSPPGPGRNGAGLAIYRYRTRCGTVFGHTGSFPGYRIFAAASRDGRRSVVFLANAQVVPGQGSKRVSDMIRRAQGLAVCRALMN